ncbi:hypothetical protein DFH28DRAFT_942034 [Melampsora americana]|nr:hypothetical protein DFH28DRAFT_942034 [Melampsora americana]
MTSDSKTHSEPNSVSETPPVIPYNVDSGSNSSDSHSTVREDLEQKNSDNLTSISADPQQKLSEDEKTSKPDESNVTKNSQSNSNVPPVMPVPLAEAQAPSSEAASEPARELTNVSAEVRELAIMFPQIPVPILEAVLAAHQNDPGECISDLLAMNDPSWKPAPEDIMKSDEALARQLAREEEEVEQQIPVEPTPQFNLPYQPRIKRNPSNRVPVSTYESRPDPSPFPQPGQSSSNLTGKDEIQKIADEFSKMAETGKKTVSTWLNKAKAKIQELQQPPADLSSDSIKNENHLHPSQPEIIISGAEYGGSSSNTKRSSRISPALPYSSRYDSTPSTRTPADPATGSVTTHPSLQRTSSPAVETKRGDEMMDTQDRTGKSKEVTTRTTMGKTESLIPNKPITNVHRTRDEDEESLEYTRNPFEDED